MGKLIFLPFIALLAATGPAPAAPTSVVNDVVPSDSQQVIGLAGGAKSIKAPQEKKICKQLETSGTRLPRRACLTEQEWKQLEEELQQ